MPTFQRKFIKCGKKGCQKCPHGPYWYLEENVFGKVKWKYVGRTIPDHLRQAAARQGIFPQDPSDIDVVRPESVQELPQAEPVQELGLVHELEDVQARLGLKEDWDRERCRKKVWNTLQRKTLSQDVKNGIVADFKRYCQLCGW